ncbi:MAG: hypothetical protein K2N30_05955 [Clostridia bacterium]|nr:hypothetical protein [Clostridia bacterium]
MSKEKLDAKWKVEAERFAADIALAIEDLFEGEIKTDGAVLNVNFINGQSFKVLVEEIK